MNIYIRNAARRLDSDNLLKPQKMDQMVPRTVQTHTREQAEKRSG